MNNQNPSLPQGAARSDGSFLTQGYHAVFSAEMVPVAATPAHLAWPGQTGTLDASRQQPAAYQAGYTMSGVWQQAQSMPVSPQHLVMHPSYTSASQAGLIPVHVPQYPSGPAAHPQGTPLALAPSTGVPSSPMMNYRPLMRGPQSTTAKRLDAMQLALPSPEHRLPTRSSSFNAPGAATPPGTPDEPLLSAAAVADKAYGILCAHALQVILAGAAALSLKMLTLTPAISKAMTAAMTEINAACPHLSEPLAFSADDHTVTGALNVDDTAADADAARWFLQLFQQHHPSFSTLPVAAELLLRNFDPELDVETATPRDHKAYIRGRMAYNCRDDWLVVFPYVCALDWEVTPGCPQNGR
jgi:hypothetical protein